MPAAMIPNVPTAFRQTTTTGSVLLPTVLPAAARTAAPGASPSALIRNTLTGSWVRSGTTAFSPTWM